MAIALCAVVALHFMQFAHLHQSIPSLYVLLGFFFLILLLCYFLVCSWKLKRSVFACIYSKLAVLQDVNVWEAINFIQFKNAIRKNASFFFLFICAKWLDMSSAYFNISFSNVTHLYTFCTHLHRITDTIIHLPMWCQIVGTNTHTQSSKHLSSTVQCKHPMTNFLNDTTLSAVSDQLKDGQMTREKKTTSKLKWMPPVMSWGFCCLSEIVHIHIHISGCFCLHRMSIDGLIVVFSFDIASVLMFVSLINQNRCAKQLWIFI